MTPPTRRTRKLHRIIGIVMLLPLAGWAVTGALFFVKPGWGAAYDSLPVRTYPLDSTVTIATRPGWLEVRRVRTILGDHLLARTDEGWRQFDHASLAVVPPPTDDQVRTLVGDALAINPARYGAIAGVDHNVVSTATGARITLDWNRLALSQRGRDTDRIDWLYRVHYLQWTGHAGVDRVVGGAGLVLLLTLSAFGARLAIGRSRV
jgi:hypothetical protein